jgi:hypothetical protein
MNTGSRQAKVAALALVVGLPLLGLSGVATAAVHGAKAAPNCVKHPHRAACRNASGSGSGTGTGPATPVMTVQIDPNPNIETAQSELLFTVQVETSPSFAGDDVTISSSQLAASCSPLGYGFFAFDETPASSLVFIQVPLDDEGNTTVAFSAQNCAPGTSVVEASLDVAPYYTALGTVTAAPPVVTPTGVFGYPTTSGTVTGGEVETGDSGPITDQSDVYAVFYVETDPVYAEQTVEISSSQLQDRCGSEWFLESVGDTVGEPEGDNGGSFGVGSVLDPKSPTTATSVLDDDGNAAFIFSGASCAAGPSEVIADVDAGTHPTYTTTFTVLAPQPTI